MNNIPEVISNIDTGDAKATAIELAFTTDDPIVVGYLTQFEHPKRVEKALDALKVGVIAIQSASPTLDTKIVDGKFKEVQENLQEHVREFQEDLTEELEKYFKEHDGVVPKSLDDLFGDNGALGQTFESYFKPKDGKLARVLEEQIGPQSEFGQALDPKNKEGIIAQIEKKVEALVEERLDEVLEEFSLDKEGSAMSRLAKILKDYFADLNQALGIEAGKAEEAQRGHVKGMEFQKGLYDRIAEWGRELGDETEFVHGTPGISGRKTGDHLIILGESTGAPGLKVVVEVKDQTNYKFKDAVQELKSAKENREAVVGIFIFAKGSEPSEVGDFRRLGEDFYCTADKEALIESGPLPFIEAAYKIARAQAVTTVRSEAAGSIDLARIEQEIDAVTESIPRMADIITKAITIKRSGKTIEDTMRTVMEDIDERLKRVLGMLRLPAGAETGSG